MGTWRCPNCATLQVEALRCFLCHRSATSCGTCVNFRHSLVGGVGYCALDRRREPLSGAEQRACWSDATESAVEGFFDTTLRVEVDAAGHGRQHGTERGLVELAPGNRLSHGAARPPVSGN
ncbi:hypothetical protein BH24CHL6_BH24CHL6_12310 [soil metagenome]